MAIPDERLTALETEVAEVIGILLETLSDETVAEDDVGPVAAGIGRYLRQVQRIGVAAAAAGFLGLQDICMLFQEGLAELGARATGLSACERAVLEEWPTLVIGYLESPLDPLAREALIEHLRNPGWICPLSGEEAEILQSLLAAQVEDARPAAWDGASSSDGIVEPPRADAGLTSEGFEQAEEALAATGAGNGAAVAASGELIAAVPEAAAHATSDEEALYESGRLPPPEEVEVRLPGELGAPVRKAGRSAATIAQGDTPDAPMPESYQDELLEVVESPPSVVPTRHTEAGDHELCPAPRGSDQELVEILRAEIAEIANAAAKTLALGASDSVEADVRRHALESHAEDMERLAQASEAVGLAGLHRICIHIRSNLLELRARSDILTTGERRILEGWPVWVLNYLEAMSDRQACEAVLDYLGDSRWPIPLSETEAGTLLDGLMAGTLEVEEIEIEERPRHLGPEDVSLELPEDVNPELLDSLLQELPGQTAEFSTAIQNLIEGAGNLKDVDVAQRVAHTLKGAANTVGVRGIATLTHHMEDILLALSRRAALPTRPLAETLMSAADCLETMSEALLGLSPPPSQAVGVMQEVLDWANRIDRRGIPVGEDAPEPRVPAVVATKPAPGRMRIERAVEAPQPAQGAAMPMLRVPAFVVDELLRLVGESIILTGQLQERIRKADRQAQAVREQNHTVQQLTLELEQLVDIRGITSPLAQTLPEDDFDPLEFDRYSELHTVTRRLVEAATDSREMGRGLEEHLAALDALLIDQGRLHKASQAAVLHTRMVPIQTVVPRLQRSVRQTCRLTDKQAELSVSGAELLMDSNVLSDLLDPLMHVLRNAVDHGIEPAELRRVRGKDSTGRITLTFTREGNHILVRCQDDGAGLDRAAIRRTAERMGVVGPGQALGEDELKRLILMPGFSTRTETTQVSGRGIGMDAVYSRLIEIKGSLQIQSRPGEGCLVEFRLPVSLISTHALLVQVRQHVFAVSSRGVERILYPGSGELQRLGELSTYRMADELYEVSALESLLNLAQDRRTEERKPRPALLVRDEAGAMHVVLVQEVLDSRDLVVKSMGRYIPKLTGIVGATILGDGSVAPVLDLPELLRAAAEGYCPPAPRVQALPDAPARPARRCALIVDDSLSARRSLAQFIEDAGFDVRTARDGLEAIGILQAKRPDMLVVDLEMPRMNGLELTSHVRACDATHDLPVLMITSRSTEKHRRQAQRAGVDVYLTKPFAEDELLYHIGQILGRS